MSDERSPLRLLVAAEERASALVEKATQEAQLLLKNVKAELESERIRRLERERATQEKAFVDQKKEWETEMGQALRSFETELHQSKRNENALRTLVNEYLLGEHHGAG